MSKPSNENDSNESPLTGPNCLEAQEARGDFWLMLETAVTEAHGYTDVDQLKFMNFGEVVDLLAQNGLRMVYFPGKSLFANVNQG